MANHLQQPQPLDLVGNPIQIAGIAGEAFEANFQYRITEGHDEVTGNFMAGGGTGEHGQFQIQVDVSGAAFTLPRLFVEIFEVSASDGVEINMAARPVLYGPLIVPGYYGYRLHTVAPGDTLFAIAEAHYGDGSLYHRIATANPVEITDPDLIRPGQSLRIPMGT